jgi:hypothetical protein
MPIAILFYCSLSLLWSQDFLHTWIAVEIPEIALQAQILLSCNNISILSDFKLINNIFDNSECLKSLCKYRYSLFYE